MKQSYFNISLAGIEDSCHIFLWLTTDFYIMSMSRSTLELNNCPIYFLELKKYVKCLCFDADLIV